MIRRGDEIIKPFEEQLLLKIGCGRISTKDQHLELQIDALKKAGCEKIYQDIASGARSERPALNELIHNLRLGDVLVIWKLDRLGRTLNHLIVLVNDFMEKRSGCKACMIPLTPLQPKGGWALTCSLH